MVHRDLVFVLGFDFDSIERSLFGTIRDRQTYKAVVRIAVSPLTCLLVFFNHHFSARRLRRLWGCACCLLLGCYRYCAAPHFL